MEKTLIFGHKSPDTDTIISSICLANLKSKLGKQVEAVRLGELNKETEYVLKYFGVDNIRKIESINEGQSVILVDHNEFTQSVSGIEKANIKMVIDHHRIKGFETAEPLYYRAEPVGCTATIIYTLYLENGVEIDKNIAGLLMSAIISDTLLFKSPTCTTKDVEVAKTLADICGVDIEKYGLDMLKAGTALSDYSEKDLINLDAKEFMLGDIKAVVAQVNTVDIDEVLKRKDKLSEEINKEISNRGLGIFAFLITDILNSNSEALVLGDRSDIFEKAFDKKLEDNLVFLPGVISRKKQIIPPMTKNA